MIKINRLFLLRLIPTVIVVVAALFVARGLWRHYEEEPWTRDGRVRADVVEVAPDVSGLITAVAVRDNQAVKAGDLLFTVDQPRYRLAVEQAQAAILAQQPALREAKQEAARNHALRDLVAAGYRGPEEVEIFSARTWWRRDPATVLDVIVERYRALASSAT